MRFGARNGLSFLSLLASSLAFPVLAGWLVATFYQE